MNADQDQTPTTEGTGTPRKSETAKKLNPQKARRNTKEQFSQDQGVPSYLR
jgi:hypothetical protein